MGTHEREDAIVCLLCWSSVRSDLSPAPMSMYQLHMQRTANEQAARHTLTRWLFIASCVLEGIWSGELLKEEVSSATKGRAEVKTVRTNITPLSAEVDRCHLRQLSLALRTTALDYSAPMRLVLISQLHAQSSCGGCRSSVVPKDGWMAS